jgi:hypothetical protein
LWKTSGTFDNKLGRTGPRPGQNVFGLVCRNINNKAFNKIKLWKPKRIPKLCSPFAGFYQNLIIKCLPFHYCQLWLHELKQAFSFKFCNISPTVRPPCICNCQDASKQRCRALLQGRGRHYMKSYQTQPCLSPPYRRRCDGVESVFKLTFKRGTLLFGNIYDVFRESLEF